MPKRNLVKKYGEEQYYHVYNRGVDKQPIFKEEDDYWYFLSLFKRHLSLEVETNSAGYQFKNYKNEVELIAFCLMPNHYHLLCYLKDPNGLRRLMQSVMTAYTMYFNKKYNRVGSLYQGIFLAAHVSTDEYLWHVSRYIHLNPVDIDVDFRMYPYSSIDYFIGSKRAAWINAERLVETEVERQRYAEFVADYNEMHQQLHAIKHSLANP